uniref:Small ribosomal subunit protein uS10m n=1 Tax=Ceriodaphnia reticulata TaxID=302197 RepID=A0A4Y7LWH1_9CRUS|nr:EOG090X0GP9 [Ceriodaphnia reticulata]SVE73271.1 EOG090X0GP9 [Ceriodaphnia reticulata]
MMDVTVNLFNALGTFLGPLNLQISVYQDLQNGTNHRRLDTRVLTIGSDRAVLEKMQSDHKQDSLYKNIEIEIRCAEPAVLKSYEWFTTYAAKQLGVTIGKCWAPSKAHHNRLTLLKSIHIYKKHRVQYEIRTYFRYMTFERLTESTAGTFLEYVQRNVPEGVAMKVTKCKLPYRIIGAIKQGTRKIMSKN